MAQDFGWERPAAEYAELYDDLARHCRDREAGSPGADVEHRDGFAAAMRPLGHQERIHCNTKEDPMTEDRESRIRRRAYALWEEEGRPDGRTDEHWAWAEAEIMAEEDREKASTENPRSKPAESDEAVPRKKKAAG